MKAFRLFSNFFKHSKSSALPKLLAFPILGYTAYNSFSHLAHSDENLVEKELCSVDELQDGQMKRFQVGPDEKKDLILLAKVEGKFYAVGLQCSHFGFPLDKGELFGDRLVCPLHLASFSVKTGLNELGPVFKGLPTYKIEVKGGKVFATVPSKLENFTQQFEGPKEKKLPDKHFVIVGGGPAG